VILGGLGAWSVRAQAADIAVVALLQRELARKGEPLSINRMLEELGGIRETLVVYRAVKANGRLPPPLASPA